MLRGKANSMKKLVLGGLSAAVMAFSMNAMAADLLLVKTIPWLPIRVKQLRQREKLKYVNSFGTVARTALSLNHICKRG